MVNLHPTLPQESLQKTVMFAEFVHNTLGYTWLCQHPLQGWSHGVVVSFIFHLYRSFTVIVNGIGLPGLYI